MPIFYKSYKKIKIQCLLQDLFKGISGSFQKSKKGEPKAIKRMIQNFKHENERKKVICEKRALRFTPFSGLMTVEAAVVIPVFLAAVLMILSVIQLLGMRQELLIEAATTAHEAAVYGYEEDYGKDDILTDLVLNLYGSEIDFSQISGGAAGIDYGDTDYDAETGEMDICLSCEALPILNWFDVGGVDLSVSLKTRAFIGGKFYDESAESEDAEGKTVYVAENGVVYHTSRSCAYIDITLRAVKLDTVDDLRNSQGGKYYACELCGDEDASSVVYLTDTGNRYHTTSTCSAVSRTVYEMTLTDDCELPACSRCGK